jgi:hypothetical protein
VQVGEGNALGSQLLDVRIKFKEFGLEHPIVGIIKVDQDDVWASRIQRLRAIR